ncbi:MAG: N-acetylglucosamine-6-phosphate deacetylase [Oscillospiraceae bacterium]|nr:N-acetylglucosamine-6-phosphate deacetylase [Oscillospiraceae bacterium]
MKDLLITNARVVLADAVTEGISVLLSHGKIKALDCKYAPSDAQVLDAQGNYLLAGFIDTHVHGGGGADFMEGTVESFHTVTETHLRYGTTALCPTSMTASAEETEQFVRTYLAYLQTERKGAKTLGLHLEGPYFSGANEKSKGAQRGDLLRYPDMEEVKRLYALSQGHIVRWDAAPELPGIEEMGKFLSSKGVVCSMGHSQATTEEAERAIAAGFSHVTHCYNACSTYRKVGQKVLDGVVEAAYLHDDVVIELICDGCHIPRGILAMAVKIKGADKVCGITDAMRIAGTDLKVGYLGTKTCGSEVVVDDGVAKLKDLSSFAGSIATTERCLQTLCGKYGLPICTASKLLSLAPAKLLGVEDVMGSIAVGKAADLVLADEDFNITAVFLDGKKAI